MYGRPYEEAALVPPSKRPAAFPANDTDLTLLKQLRILAGNPSISQSNYLPWSFDKTDIHNLFRSLVSFADDHMEPLSQKYFPVDESHHLIKRVLRTSNLIDAPLSLPNQLDIALEITNGQLLAAGILCHSASRAIGRNRDQRIDSSFRFTSEEMKQWSASIARFDDANQYDPPGDTYHFWATFSMGMTLRRSFEQQPISSMAYGLLFYLGADITDASRRFVARNPLFYKHKEVDRMGLKIGWDLGS